MDSDGYDTSYSISNKDYAKIVSIAKKYAKEKCENEGSYIDPEEFGECFKQKDPSLYDKIDKIVKKELSLTAMQTAGEWFNEEEEGCTIEEYIDNIYTCGFYISEEVISQLLS